MRTAKPNQWAWNTRLQMNPAVAGVESEDQDMELVDQGGELIFLRNRFLKNFEFGGVRHPQTTTNQNTKNASKIQRIFVDVHMT